MNKTAAIAELIRVTTNEPIIFTTGYSCRIARSISDRTNHFYMTGSMGLAANIGVGVALASPLPVVVADGDGSLAMNPGCLLTAGAFPELHLVHVVLDDGRYESTGGQLVPSAHVDFCQSARAAGYLEVSHVDELADFGEALARGLKSSRLTFVHCSVTVSPAADPPPRIAPDLRALSSRFVEHLKIHGGG